MNIVRYSDPKLLLRNAGPWLNRDEPVNNVVIGVCNDLIRRPGDFGADVLLLTLEDAGGVAGVVLMTPPRQLVASKLPGKTVEELTRFLVESQLPLPGVFGPTDHAGALARHWQRVTGGSISLSMNLTLYQCQTVRAIRHSNGFLRAANKGDLELLVNWRRAFDTEAGTDNSHEPDARVVEREVFAGETFIWVDGQPVCATVVGRESDHGATITYVYTAPQHRGQGYATNCVSAVTETLLESGKDFTTLFADSTNTTANRVYRSIGYEAIDKFQLWNLSEKHHT